MFGSSAANLYVPPPSGQSMAIKGLKQTSELVQISGNVVEGTANTFQQDRIDLQLDVLSREVFVVVACDINASLPDADPTNNETIVRASLSTVSRTTVGTLNDTNTFATSRSVIVSDPASVPPQIAGIYTDASTETPHAQLDYIHIIATNDFYAQVLGTGNTRVKASDFRVWGYRATASADVFAALTQSELLSQ